MDCSCFSRSRKWADLPIELLGLILDKLGLVANFIRFGAVCKSWSLACTQACNSSHTISFLYQEPPMLLIPAETGSKDYKRLYSIWEDEIYPYRLQIPHRDRYYGSGYGWLAYAEENDAFLGFSVTLLNPFSGITIRLPTIMENIPYFECNLKKVILSCDPCLYPDDWVVVAIVGSCLRLEFIRSGEDSWKRSDIFRVDDACFYKKKLYIIKISYDHLIVIDFSKHNEHASSIVAKIMLKSPRGDYYSGTYLVELERDLFLVRRIYHKKGIPESHQIAFKVWKLSDSANTNASAEWIEVDDLGKFSVFLGDFKDSVAVYNSSNIANFQSNCIYYTDDPCEAAYFGIYNLANANISRYYFSQHLQGNRFPSTLWITPTLVCK